MASDNESIDKITDDDLSESEYITDDEDFCEFALLIAFPRKVKKFQHRPDHFLKWTDGEFYDHFRLSKSTVKYVLGLIRQQISSPTTR